MQTKDDTLFLVGSYTDVSVLAHTPKGGQGDGIYSVALCSKTVGRPPPCSASPATPLHMMSSSPAHHLLRIRYPPFRGSPRQPP